MIEAYTDVTGREVIKIYVFASDSNDVASK
jgi:hypothetical protein